MVRHFIPPLRFFKALSLWKKLCWHLNINNQNCFLKISVNLNFFKKSIISVVSGKLSLLSKTPSDNTFNLTPKLSKTFPTAISTRVKRLVKFSNSHVLFSRELYALSNNAIQTSCPRVYVTNDASKKNKHLSPRDKMN